MDFDLNNYVMHHVADSHEWHMPFLPTIPLPSFLSLHGLMLLICAGLLIFLFCFVYDKKAKVPSGMTNFLEAFVVYIRDEIAAPFLGKEDGRKFTPLFCTFFFFILSANLIGLIPGFATATANISVTGALAIITLCFMIFAPIMKNGVGGFVKALIPSGIPGWTILLLLPIEFLSLFIKSFALMIRLFANLLAGHIVIFSILGLVVLLGLYALPAIFLALFIYMLEIFVAFLQAYIFTFLSALFIGQTLHPDH